MKTSTLQTLAIAALSGALFGIGLYVSQMIDPLKVLRFLDFSAIPAGGWDPSLAFVMAAGLIVMVAAVRLGGRRRRPLFDSQFHEPALSRIDAPLLIGAALFGIGWGMAGICPGPAISLVAFWPPNLLIYLMALFLGSYAGGVVISTSHTRSLALIR